MGFHRQQLNKRVVSDLQKRSTAGVFFYILVPPIVLMTDGYMKRHLTFSLVFLGVFLFVCLFRLAHVYVFKKMPERFDSLNNRIFLVSVLLSALPWSSGLGFFLLYAGE